MSGLCTGSVVIERLRRKGEHGPGVGIDLIFILSVILCPKFDLIHLPPIVPIQFTLGEGDLAGLQPGVSQRLGLSGVFTDQRGGGIAAALVAVLGIVVKRKDGTSVGINGVVKFLSVLGVELYVCLLYTSDAADE